MEAHGARASSSPAPLSRAAPASSSGETCVTLQCLIEISADHLAALRTQCSVTDRLTQNEIRCIEGKLIKLFASQLVAYGRESRDLVTSLAGVTETRDLDTQPPPHQPCLQLWLHVVGLCQRSIRLVSSQYSTVEALLKARGANVTTLLDDQRERDQLTAALNHLHKYLEVLTSGCCDVGDTSLSWDSWRCCSPSSTSENRVLNVDDGAKRAIAGSNPSTGGDAGAICVVDRGTNTACSRQTTTASRHTHTGSHCSLPGSGNQSAVTTGKAAGTVTTAVNDSLAPPGGGAGEQYAAHSDEVDASIEGATRPSNSPVTSHTPRSPHTPTFPASMCHVISHKFAKTFKMATCDYCGKQMIYGVRCRECRYKCHRHCEPLVPPSCGLPRKFVDFFIDQVHSQGCVSPVVAARGGAATVATGGAARHRNRHRTASRTAQHAFIGDSSSTTSSCSSTAPSSPAAFPSCTNTTPVSGGSGSCADGNFHFPDVSPATAARLSVPSGGGGGKIVRALAAAKLAPSISVVSSQAGGVYKQRPPPLSLAQSTVVPAICRADSSVITAPSIAVEADGHADSGSVVTTVSSASVDSEASLLTLRMDSQDSNCSHEVIDSGSMHRQDSLSQREWDIAFDEVRLLEEIGRGRLGAVYRAHWHGEVAVKLVSASDPATVRRFQQDVATLRKTRHENVVLFMGACVSPPRLAIVTSLCRGTTLYTQLHVLRHRLNLARIVDIARHVSLGMGYLHARGIVHRDLKTKNVFVDSAGTVVITDFGLVSLSTSRCCHGQRCGCVQLPRGWLCYLAPEIVRQLRGGDVEPLPFTTASDVFAFGTVWYELLAGEWPWRGQPVESIVWMTGSGLKQPLANIQASRDVKNLLMRCWHFSSELRPSFSELVAWLERLPKKRACNLTRSPSHPLQLSRSVESVF